MKHKILITGSEGFIGKRLKHLLKSKGHYVDGVDKLKGQDLSNWQEVRALDDNYDYVYHLAAFNGTKWFYDKPVSVIRDNFYPTEHILKKYSGKCKKIIFAGTCESYVGSTDFFSYPIPTDEEVPLSIADPKNVRWSYGASKLLNEVMVWSYSKEYNQNCSIVRYHNIYGPGQVDHFIPDFITRVINDRFELFGHENTRSFMYIDDACEATIKIGESEEKNQTYHVGSGEETKIIDVAEKILKIMGKADRKIQLNKAPLGSVNRRCPNVKKMKDLMGQNYRYTNLEEGLKLTIGYDK